MNLEERIDLTRAVSMVAAGTHGIRDGIWGRDHGLVRKERSEVDSLVIGSSLSLE